MARSRTELAVMRHIRLRNRAERWLYTRVRRAQRALVADILSDPTPSGIEASVGAYATEMADILTRFYTLLVERCPSLLDDTPKLTPVQTKGLLDRMRAWVRDNVGHRITRISESTLARVQDMYTRTGGDVSEFKDELSLHFKDARARRIAVTETTGAVNATVARLSDEYSFGRRRVKTWHTCGLLGVRPSHQAMNGVTVDADQPFEVIDDAGRVNRLMFPSDMSSDADPSVTVNCRCLCTYRYADGRASRP